MPEDENPDVPWTTAPEHVDAILAELDVSDATAATARELAERYDGEFGLKPLSVAAGAVYWAGMVENDKVTQARLAEASGRSAASIRTAYREIATAEGVDVSPRPRDEEGEDTGRGRPDWSYRRPTLPKPGLATVITVCGVVALTGWLLTMPAFTDPATTAAFERAAERTVGPPGSTVYDLAWAVAFVAAVVFFLRPLRWVVR